MKKHKLLVIDRWPFRVFENVREQTHQTIHEKMECNDATFFSTDDLPLLFFNYWSMFTATSVMNITLDWQIQYPNVYSMRGEMALELKAAFKEHIEKSILDLFNPQAAFLHLLVFPMAS